ncbi:MAG: DUF4062 domain-containing protein [Lachnospiraceae bacterium]|nr:DUF4062 domain-containing protein [Lachnospiraceae bacterium]
MYRQLVPMLSKEAFENGDTIAIRDLRWGVNTSDEKSEEEANQKVLSVCLDEIDECRPYMIILLGYRYGFCPGKELIARAVKERNALAGTEARADRFALKDENISITEMEIRYGAFWKRSGSASPRILVYIRDIDSGEGLEIPKVFLQENEEYWARQQKLI